MVKEYFIVTFIILQGFLFLYGKLTEFLVPNVYSIVFALRRKEKSTEDMH